MKKRTKKTLSAVVTAAMILSNLTALSVSADVATYADWTPGEKPANLIPDASASGGYTYLGTRIDKMENAFWAYDSNIANSENPGYYVRYYYTGTDASLSLTNPWAWFEGLFLNTRDGNFGFVPEGGKTYAMSLNLKNASEEGVSINFGATMNCTYGPANAVHTNEYGKEGMPLTDEWTKFNVTLTLPDDYNGAENMGSSITLGIPEGSPVGSAFLIDAASKDAAYFAEEQVYDITNVIDKTTVQQGSSINAKAEVLNQVGTKGAINQTVNWFVVNADRSEVVSEGFEITSDTNSATAVVKAAADAPVGDYVLIAHSDLNGGMYKGAAFSVQEVKWPEFESGELTANLIPDASAAYGSKYLGRRTGTNMENTYFGYDSNIATSENPGYYVKYSYPNTDASLSLTNPWACFEGLFLNTADTNFGFVPEGGKTYAMSLNLKNASEEGVSINFGATMNCTYGPANAVHTNEYGAEGMPLTDEWTKFNVTLTLPDDYNGAENMGSSITLGIPEGSPVGSAFLIDAASKDAVYIAEEQLYHFNNTADKNSVLSGESFTASAELLNQVGTNGSLDQTFDWFVTDTEKTQKVDGFNIEVNSNGKSAKVTPGYGVLPGNYLLTAYSPKYDVYKSVEFTVEGGAYYIDTVSSMPENIYPSGIVYTDRNNSAVNEAVSSTTADGVSAVEWETNAEVANVWVGHKFAGSVLNKSYKITPFKANTNYVFSAKVRNSALSADESPYWGIAMGQETGEAVAGAPYESGMAVTSENWMDYKVTVKQPDNFDPSLENNKGDGWIFMGFSAAKANAKVQLDRNSVYMAEEKPYSISISADDDLNLVNKTSIGFKAEVLNQIGIQGNIAQEFDWVAVETDRKTPVEEIRFIQGETSAEVTAEFDSGLASGEYIIAAVSKVDGLVRTVNITISKEVETIYVAPNGSDSASGTQDAPLATLSGARDKVRTMKDSGIDAAIDVIFAGGTYYFDSTVDFTSQDSGTEAAKVTYKAADGEKVVFTGAVALDLASAQKVTDEGILSRLKDKVKDKVVVIDLSEKISLSDESIYATIQKLCGEYEYPELYLDGNEQMIAQWPNGNAEYAAWGYVDQDTISYTDDEPSKWTNAKDWWIGGYFSYDYNYMRLPVTLVDTANKQISFEIDAANSVKADNSKTEKSYRWKAFNLLEEIDTPMEWYIDKDNMKLYYYPSKMSGKLEISSLKSSMIDITEADYIGFEGIQFENTRGNAVTATNIEGVTVKGCTFKNIGTDAFAVYGTALAESDKNYWQRQYVDAAYNCEISDSIFNNIGGHAVLMDGGNVDTLTKGNNVIKNNIFYKGAQKIKNYETILLKGCGNEIINNNISRSAFQAIRHYGNDHKIMYNEIYNVIQETDDCGAIYCGRNTIQRGTEIAYNYLHDLKSTDTLPFGHQVAVYLDDGQTGINVHHNIIKNVNKNVYTNGVDNTFNYNTSIDIAKTNLDFKDGGAASNADPETTAFSGHIADTELYYSVYPNLKTIVEASDRTDSSLALLNTLKGNLCVRGPGGNGIGDNTMYSKKPTTILGFTIKEGETNPNVSNNNDNGVASVFVNAANQDYRVKGTDALETSVLNESFNIDLIGVQSANAITASEISLAAPYDEENINAETVHFSWNDSFGATSYTVTVASDADFTNVIAEKDSYYSFADIEIQANGASYYWKVTAHNTSREFNSDWESAVQSFTNGEKITATAVLGSNNQIALSITNNYYTQGKAANVYIAEYDNDGKLLAAQILSTSLPYQQAETFEGKTVTLKNAAAADVKLFIWDTNYSPLRETVTIK